MRLKADQEAARIAKVSIHASVKDATDMTRSGKIKNQFQSTHL